MKSLVGLWIDTEAGIEELWQESIVDKSSLKVTWFLFLWFLTFEEECDVWWWWWLEDADIVCETFDLLFFWDFDLDIDEVCELF